MNAIAGWEMLYSGFQHLFCKNQYGHGALLRGNQAVVGVVISGRYLWHENRAHRYLGP